jgi:long-chain acyl-CoA synthetase
MKGYYKDPDATAMVLKDGWFHSGDLGYCDQDGYYYITGRKKNVIVMSNGEKLNPEETEHYLMTCDAVLECIVSYKNDALCLDVYTKDIEATKAFLKDYHEKMPTSFHFQKISYSAAPFQKNSTGKIIREEHLS